MRVLLAEDSQSMVEVLTLTLINAGCSVVSGADGEQALRYACQTEFDLIFTDLNMPRMNGIELVRQIRFLCNDSKNKYTPIIFITTESQMDKKKEAQSAGATGWIVKPFKPEQLVKIVDKFRPRGK